MQLKLLAWLSSVALLSQGSLSGEARQWGLPARPAWASWLLYQPFYHSKLSLLHQHRPHPPSHHPLFYLPPPSFPQIHSRLNLTASSAFLSVVFINHSRQDRSRARRLRQRPALASYRNLSAKSLWSHQWSAVRPWYRCGYGRVRFRLHLQWTCAFSYVYSRACSQPGSILSWKRHQRLNLRCPGLQPARSCDDVSAWLLLNRCTRGCLPLSLDGQIYHLPPGRPLIDAQSQPPKHLTPLSFPPLLFLNNQFI